MGKLKCILNPWQDEDQGSLTCVWRFGPMIMLEMLEWTDVSSYFQGISFDYWKVFWSIGWVEECKSLLQTYSWDMSSPNPDHRSMEPSLKLWVNHCFNQFFNWLQPPGSPLQPISSRQGTGSVAGGGPREENEGPSTQGGRVGRARSKVAEK